MFSGIVEEYAEVVRIVKEQENLHLTLKCSFVDELKIDQSISHNGVCLTVVSLQDGRARRRGNRRRKRRCPPFGRHDPARPVFPVAGGSRPQASLRRI